MDKNEAQKKAKKHLYEKIGDCLMDVAKYCITAVLITSIFTDLKALTPVFAYVSSAVFFIFVFALGARIVYQQKRKEYADE